MDILFLSDSNVNCIGGAEKSIKIILEGMTKKYNVGLIHPGETKLDIKGLQEFNLTSKNYIKNIAKNPFLIIHYMNKVRKIIKKSKTSIIHTQSQVALFMIGFLRNFKLISKNIVLIHTDRGLQTKYNKLINYLFKKSLKNYNYLVTTTKYNNTLWEQKLNKNKKTMFLVIPNASGDLFEEFNPKFKKNNSNNIKVLFVGRYAKWKNWELAFEIMEKTINKMNDKVAFNFVIATNNKKDLQLLKDKFNSLKIKYNEKFNGYLNVEHDELNNIYYNSDIYILTSKKDTESFGRTIIEAMLRENVVLATDAGGSTEVISNMNNILDNADKFVEKISYYQENNGVMMEEQKYNREYAKNKFSVEKNISKHEKLYFEILKKGEAK